MLSLCELLTQYVWVIDVVKETVQRGIAEEEEEAEEKRAEWKVMNEMTEGAEKERNSKREVDFKLHGGSCQQP